MKKTNRSTLWIAAAAGLVLSAGVATAQADKAAAEERAVARRAQPADEAPAMDSAMLLERLNRRLAELEQETVRMRETIAKLEGGATPAQAMEGMRPPMMERRGPGPGPDGMGGPGGPEGMRGPGGPDDRGQMDEMRMRAMHERMAAEREWMRREPMGPMSPEERERIVQFLETNTPRVAERFKELQAERPEVAERMLAGLRERVAEMRRVAEKDPAALDMRLRGLRTDMELRQAAMDFVMARREGDEAKQAEARAAIEALVADRVAVTLEEREVELAGLRERVEKMAAELTAARQDPQEMIAKRIDELLTRLENAPAPGEPGNPGAEGQRRREMDKRRERVQD